MANKGTNLFKKTADIFEELKVDDNIESLNKQVTSTTFPLEFGYGVSDFRSREILMEYANVKDEIQQYSKEKNLIAISTVYVYEGHESIEAGLIITNTSDKFIELHRAELALVVDENIILCNEVINFYGNVTINPGTSYFHEVSFEQGSLGGRKPEDVRVIFVDKHNIKIAKEKYLDLEDALSDIHSEKAKEFLEEKLQGLPVIREGEVIADPIMALGMNDGISIIILIRNASNHKIQFRGLPIQICMQENLPLYISSIDFPKDTMIIKKEKSKLINITIPNEALNMKALDGYMYKLKIC